jgi:hypothetical protein
MQDIFPIPVGNYKDQNVRCGFKIGIKNYDIESSIFFDSLENLGNFNNSLITTNKHNITMHIVTDEILEEEDQYITVYLYGIGSEVVQKRINILDFMAQLEDVVYYNLTPPNSPRI